MKIFQQNTTVALILLTVQFFHPSQSYADERYDNTGEVLDVFNRMNRHLVILNDGNIKAYGLYVAGDKGKKYMYFYSSRRLQIGSSEKMKVTFPGKDEKEYHVIKVLPQGQLNSPVYRVETFDHKLSPVTLAIHDSLQSPVAVWAFGRPELPRAIYGLRVVKRYENTVDLYSNFSELFLGSPIFDVRGNILGCVDHPFLTPDTLQTDSIVYLGKRLDSKEIIQNAKTYLKGLELYPQWNEIYPNQFVIDRVKKSVVLLNTSNEGGGVFVGWDKDSTGYILTAAHVVADSPPEFSLQFDSDLDLRITGKTMAGTIDRKLDLAIVTFRGIQDFQPAIFVRPDSLDKMKEDSLYQHIASIGFGNYTLWGTKKGRLKDITGDHLTSTLQLENHDSGGPMINKNGEILGINLITALQGDDEFSDLHSTSISSKAAIRYLEDHLGHVDFEEKWQFLFYRSFWDKNKAWLIPSAVVVGAGIGVAAYKLFFEPPTQEKLEGVPQFPE